MSPMSGGERRTQSISLIPGKTRGHGLRLQMLLFSILLITSLCVITVAPRRSHLWARLTAVTLIAVCVGLFVWRSVRVSEPLNLTSRVLSDTYRPVVNIPWVRYGADFGGVTKWQTSGISHDPQAISSWLRMLADHGVSAVVWFLFGDGRGSLDFDQNGFVRGLAPD
jgi:hypothetical protein